MKKRTRFLCLILLLLLCGCNEQHSPQEPVRFLYPNAQLRYGTADGAFSYEIREGAALQLEELLSLYLRGPVTDDLSQPFPDSVSVAQLRVEDRQAVLVLSDEYAELSGLSLSVANTCLSVTVMELTNTDSVRISCLSKSLDGEREVLLTKQSIILYDESVGSSSENNTTAPSVR